MRFVDDPVRLVRRTPRELLVIGIAATTAITSWLELGTRDVGNTLAFAAVAVAFAVRFFAARVIATAVAVSATGLHLAYAWREGFAARPLLGVAYFLTAILILGGRDLVARFDDAPSRGRILHNFWRELSTADRRRLALVVHGVALTLSMLYYVRQNLLLARQDVPLWLEAGIVGAAAVGVLLLFGRAIAALLAATAGAALAAVLAAHAPVAWSVATGTYVTLSMPAAARVAPQLMLAATAAAALTAMASAPWAWRLVARSLKR
jgi:hypothetical protein